MGTAHAEAPVLEHRGQVDQEINPSMNQVIATAPDKAGIVVAIDRILVQNRYRTDLGPVGELASSIVEVGLLNPITVTEYHGGYRLVAGERRLRAFQSLGLTEIPARIARNIFEARDLLVAERDENTQRKEMLKSEATALGMAIEALEKPAAAERQALGRVAGGEVFAGRQASGSREPQASAPRPRDLAAEAAGLSRASYVRIKHAVETAADPEQSPSVREVARDVVSQIDQGAPVRVQVARIAEAKEAEQMATPSERRRSNDPTDYLTLLADMHPTARIAYEKDAQSRYSTLATFGDAARRAGVEWRFTEKQWQARATSSADVLNRSTLAIEVALSAIAERVHMETITPDQANEALERLASTTAIRRIIKSLQEISNV